MSNDRDMIREIVIELIRRGQRSISYTDDPEIGRYSVFISPRTGPYIDVGRIEFDDGDVRRYIQVGHADGLIFDFPNSAEEFFAFAEKWANVGDEYVEVNEPDDEMSIMIFDQIEKQREEQNRQRTAMKDVERLQKENAALKVENAALRKSIDDLARTVAAEDPGISRSSGGDAESWERRAREYANAFDRVVEKIEAAREDFDRSDSTLFRAIADDPKAYPDGDRG